MKKTIYDYKIDTIINKTKLNCLYAKSEGAIMDHIKNGAKKIYEVILSLFKAIINVFKYIWNSFVNLFNGEYLRRAKDYIDKSLANDPATAEQIAEAEYVIKDIKKVIDREVTFKKGDKDQINNLLIDTKDEAKKLIYFLIAFNSFTTSPHSPLNKIIDDELGEICNDLQFLLTMKEEDGPTSHRDRVDNIEHSDNYSAIYQTKNNDYSALSYNDLLTKYNNLIKKDSPFMNDVNTIDSILSLLIDVDYAGVIDVVYTKGHHNAVMRVAIKEVLSEYTRTHNDNVSRMMNYFKDRRAEFTNLYNIMQDHIKTLDDPDNDTRYLQTVKGALILFDTTLNSIKRLAERVFVAVNSLLNLIKKADMETMQKYINARRAYDTSND